MFNIEYRPLAITIGHCKCLLLILSLVDKAVFDDLG